MEMFRKHTSPLLVIIAGLLSCIATADSYNPRIYRLCELSTPTGLWVTPTSEPFIIQSPNFTHGSYPNNVDCTFTITSVVGPMVLSFEYRLFNLEVKQDCTFDYLCVVGVKFCGNWTTGRIFKQIIPLWSSSTVHFRTDSSVTRNGFYIIVTSQPVLTIQQVQGSGWSESNITYVSATYYSGMPYTDRCRPNTVVPNALNDTDDYTQQNTYYFWNNVQSNYIDINSGSSPLFIRSPHYGIAPYDDGLNCSLVIRSGAEPLVLALRIKDFQLESHTTCGYDYLCVHGTKFCGEWLSGNKFQYFLTENSRFTLVFKTDGSGTRRGFEIEMSQELARTNYVVPQTTVGFVSGNFTFSNNFETYHPGYPYSDKCVAASTAVPTTGR